VRFATARDPVDLVQLQTHSQQGKNKVQENPKDPPVILKGSLAYCDLKILSG
jgi:hypothetical protein